MMNNEEQNYIDLCENKIGKLLSSEGLKFSSCAKKKLDEISCYAAISNNAKRLRPWLVYYFASLFDFDDAYIDSLANIGVCAELIHTASLLHDDVIDCANSRRGKPSANAVFKNTEVILTGDYLLTQSFSLIEPYDFVLTKKALKTIQSMTLASMEEIMIRRSIDVSIKKWEQMAAGKTAQLFSWCAFAACNLIGQKKYSENLESAAMHLGIIFQIIDDIKDFSGDSKLKDECQDIKNKEPSLPIILAATNDSNIEEKIKKYFSDDDENIEEAMSIKDAIIKSKSISLCREIAFEHKEKFMRLIKPFDTSFGYAKLSSSLQELLSFYV